MSMGRVLLVDDEPQIHRFLVPLLETAGYDVVTAATAQEALRLAAARAPEAILLDLGLPDLDGQEVLQRLRAFFRGAIIILSARDRAEEKITALDNGADDYVEKPFDVGELLARLRAALRNAAPGPAPAPVLHLGPLEIDLPRRRVLLEGQVVTLTPREYDMLGMLARHVGRVVTHRQLLLAVWGPAHVEDVQYLRVHVGQVRRKLGAAAHLLATEPGVGYRLLEGE